MQKPILLFLSCLITLCVCAQSASQNAPFISFIDNGQTLGLNSLTGIEASANVISVNNIPQNIICMFSRPATRDTLIIIATDPAGFRPGEQHVFSPKGKLTFYYKITNKGTFIKTMDNAKKEIKSGNYFNIDMLDNKPGGLLESSFGFTNIPFQEPGVKSNTEIKALENGKLRTIVSNENVFANKTKSTTSAGTASMANEVFQSIDPDYVLRKVFRPVGKNADGFYKWKPNLTNAADSNLISDDNYAYTKFYESLNYKDSADKTILFFYTAIYNNGQMSQCIHCKVSVSCVSFTRQSSGYLLNKVDSFIDFNGSEGEPAAIDNTIKIVKIGDNKYAVAMEVYDNYHGAETGEVSFYEVDNFNLIFAAEILDNNGAEIVGTGRKGHDNETKIKFLPAPGQSEYYLLQVTTTGTMENEKGKVVSANAKNTYYFDKDKMQYFLQKNKTVSK